MPPGGAAVVDEEPVAHRDRRGPGEHELEAIPLAHIPEFHERGPGNAIPVFPVAAAQQAQNLGLLERMPVEVGEDAEVLGPVIEPGVVVEPLLLVQRGEKGAGRRPGDKVVAHAHETVAAAQKGDILFLLHIDHERLGIPDRTQVVRIRPRVVVEDRLRRVGPVHPVRREGAVDARKRAVPIIARPPDRLVPALRIRIDGVLQHGLPVVLALVIGRRDDDVILFRVEGLVQAQVGTLPVDPVR